MKKSLFLLLALLFSLQTSSAQDTFFQTGHTHDILEVHFSPDDNQLVSYSAGDSRFILWDIKNGRQLWMRKTSFIRKANESTNLKEFYWSQDGKTLVTKSINGTYQTWNAQTGQILALTETKPEIEVIIPNKKKLSFKKSYNNITFNDSQSGETKVIKRFGNNSAFDTSNNGEMIAEGGSWGGASIKITEIRTGKSWFLDGHPSVIGGISYSPDGKFLAVGGSDKTIYIFDVAQNNLSKKLIGHAEPLKQLSFSPDGKTLVSADNNGVLKIWDWQNEKTIKELKSDNGIDEPEKIEFSKNGAYFLIIVNNSLGIFDAKDWTLLQTIKTKEGYESKSASMTIGYSSVPISSGVFVENGAKILTTHEDGTLRIWETISGKEIKKLKIGKIAPLVVTSDEQKIIVPIGKWDEQKLKLFEIRTGKEVQTFYEEFASKFEAISISPSGKKFITANSSGEVRLWNINQEKAVREFEIGYSGDDSIAFSPDGKTFSVGGRNQNLFLFNVGTGKKLWQLIPSYQPSELEIQLEESGEKKRAEIQVRKAERDKQAQIEVPIFNKKITAKFSHFGDAESFWDQRIAESGVANKSKLKLPRGKASVAWFALTNNTGLPVSIDTNSMIFNAKCRGLCDGAEISSRYVLELKNGETNFNGFDMFSKTILPPKTTVYFSVALTHLIQSKDIYLGYMFQKENPNDEDSDNYGTEQKLYIHQYDLPK